MMSNVHSLLIKKRWNLFQYRNFNVSPKEGSRMDGQRRETTRG